MARRRSNDRPTRNQLRDMHRLRERLAYGPLGGTDRAADDLDDELADAAYDGDGYDAEAAARAEIEAYLATQAD